MGRYTCDWRRSNTYSWLHITGAACAAERVLVAVRTEKVPDATWYSHILQSHGCLVRESHAMDWASSPMCAAIALCKRNYIPV